MRINTKKWLNYLLSIVVLLPVTLYSETSNPETETERLRAALAEKSKTLNCPNGPRTMTWGHLSGLKLVRTDSSNLTVQPGEALSLDVTTGYPNGCNMTLTVPRLKLLKCAGWQQGEGACGLTSPHTYKPSETYHVFLMMNQYGDVDIGFDIMVDGVYLTDRTPYEFVRRIGSIYTTSDPAEPVIVDFIQYGDRFNLKSPFQVYSGNPNNKAVTIQLPTPKNIQLEVIMHGWMLNSGSSTGYGYIRSIGNSDSRDMPTSTNTTRPSIIKHVMQDIAGKIEAGTTLSSDLTVTLHGWVDHRDQY